MNAVCMNGFLCASNNIDAASFRTCIHQLTFIPCVTYFIMLKILFKLAAVIVLYKTWCSWFRCHIVFFATDFFMSWVVLGKWKYCCLSVPVKLVHNASCIYITKLFLFDFFQQHPFHFHRLFRFFFSTLQLGSFDRNDSSEFNSTSITRQ